MKNFLHNCFSTFTNVRNHLDPLNLLPKSNLITFIHQFTCTSTSYYSIQFSINSDQKSIHFTFTIGNANKSQYCSLKYEKICHIL